MAKKKSAVKGPKKKPAAKRPAAKKPPLKAKPAARKVTKKPAPKKAKPAVKPAPAPPSWFDEASHKPRIAEYAQRLQPFIDAMADGKIDTGEVKAQEQRLVAMMKAVEPKLPRALHAQVTELLCELTAYDIMQLLHTLQVQRPHTTFQG
jgi:hypothetical protein